MRASLLASATAVSLNLYFDRMACRDRSPPRPNSLRPRLSREACASNTTPCQGNRVKESGSDEACEEIIVPAGGFALEALRVLAGHFTDEIVCHVL